MKRLVVPILAAVALAGCATPSSRPSGIERLYVFYCGEAQVPDLSPWSPGNNVGVRATFSDNWDLIRHADGWLLWDSGYPDALVDKPDHDNAQNATIRHAPRYYR